ncbi:MAG: type II toxin-antitoxin system VapC family toxin [Nitrospira defluvii]|nr:type II toxin-antitoxin system VapC family toxin [Nitrospira defluvii]
MPVLVDTSVWIDHLRADSPLLRQLLDDDLVMCHPLVVGELACGNLRHRAEVIEALSVLPIVHILEHEELLAFIETHRLYGQGLGWIDVHLLGAALLQHVTLWTRDQALRRAAQKLHCSFESSH